MDDPRLTPDDPQLTPEERVAFDKGVGEFNTGYFFECHDTLEDLWSGLRGPSRDFFQGLIQVAVGFYHLTGGNRAGAASMFRRALKRFEKYPDRYFAFDLAAQRSQLVEWLGRIEGDDVREVTLDEIPKWRFGD